MRKALVLFAISALALVPTLASGQNAITQNGAIAVGEIGVFRADRQLGGASQYLANTGQGLKPFRVTDNLGLGVCSDSAKTNGPYSALCIGHDASGNGIITLNSFGGAPEGLLLFSVNGSVIPAIPGSITGKAVVNSNVALQGLASTFAATVERTDFSLGFGASPVTYTSSGSACSLNGGNGDNASQVRSSDGKCWLAQFGAAGADLREWGVKFDNATDNSAPLQAALNWMVTGTGNKTLRCPSEALPALFSTAIAATFASQTASASLLGAGSDLCVLKYTGAGTAITVTHNGTNGKTNSTHWRDFTLCTTQNGSATGIKLVETAFAAGQIATNDFTTMALRGCDGWGNTNYWALGIDIQGVSVIDFRGISVTGGSGALGKSVSVAGNAGLGLYGFEYNFSGVTINNQLDAITIGALVQGVTITGGSNFTNISKGVNTISSNGADQLVVADSQFNCLNSCIVTQTGDVFIHDNYFILSANNAAGINAISTNVLHISHNSYRNGGAFTGLTGEIIGLGVSGINNIIDHNTYLSFTYSRAYTVAGNYPDVVEGNMYYSMTNPYPLLFSSVTVLSDQTLPFATVSACGAAQLDRKQHINDSNTATWGAAIAGLGVNDVWARCNGTAWNVMGK